MAMLLFQACSSVSPSAPCKAPPMPVLGLCRRPHRVVRPPQPPPPPPFPAQAWNNRNDNKTRTSNSECVSSVHQPNAEWSEASFSLFRGSEKPLNGGGGRGGGGGVVP